MGRKTRRVALASLAAVAGALLAPGASISAQQGVNLDQCANGALGAPSSCPPGNRFSDVANIPTHAAIAVGCSSIAVSGVPGHKMRCTR